MYRYIKIILLLILFTSFQVSSQSNFLESDSLPNKSRLLGASTVIGTAWVGSILGLSAVWYKDSWGGGFKFFNDADEWLQMDKFGHAYTGNHISRNTYNVYRWAGLPLEKSLLYSSLISFGYLATFEVLDGFSEDWGFSWADIAANAFGVGWFAWQELLWQEQRFKMKFSSSPSPYAKYRPEVLGSSFSERMLKDYNGQTYWFNFNPSQFMDESNSFPKWLSFSFGYSVDEKLHGFDNVYEYHDPINNEYKVFNARRQYLFSLDLDLERIPVKKKWLKTTFSLLNHLKIPFPTVEFSNGKFKAHPIYF